MKAFYKLAPLAFAAIVFTSCEKVIDLDLKNAEPQLVIEGGITNVPHIPTVKISRSVAFNEPSKFPAVSGATVTMTTGNTPISLTETSPGVYQGQAVVGRPGRTYNLQVDVDGKTYKAASTMPNQVSIDSIAVDEQSFRDNTTKTVVVYFTDPPNVKNYYRFILSVNGQLIKQVFARNDDFTDGRVTRVALYQDDVDIKSGDKIDVDMQCVDERIFTYWFTFSKQNGTAMGNASVAPTNPPNNFDKPVLGYFSAYALSHRTVTVQ